MLNIRCASFNNKRSFAVKCLALNVLYEEVAAGDFKSTGIEMMLVLRDAFI